MFGTVAACPECDATAVRSRVGKGFATASDRSEEYRCSACGALFDEPVEREREQPADQLSGLAAELDSMDADDVSGETAREHRRAN